MLRIISLFSGAGGLDLGFIRAGHTIVWANDIDPDAVETYRKNIGKHVVLGDLAEIPAEEIPDADIIMGGFPCQGFSVANMHRKISDGRNKIYLEMLRVIREKQPNYFLAENVKGLLSLGKGKIFKAIIKDFEEIGYEVVHKVINAADFGVPQTRQRVFIIGSHKQNGKKVFFPSSTHSSNPDRSGTTFPWVSIGEALCEIPEPEDALEIPNHTYSKYKLRFNGYLGHRRIDPHKPAPTVTARGDNKGGVVVLHHPKNHRRMSARELASTQSFPMNYIFHGTRSSAYRQIGNAVPPLLAEAIARIFSK